MTIAFLLAAGHSRRFDRDKLFASFGGKPIIWHSLKLLNDSQYVDAIFIAANRGNKKKIEKLAREGKFKKVKKIILGGKTRFDSVKNCLAVTRYPLPVTRYSHFLIHNAANPFATQEELRRCIERLKGNIAGVGAGRPVSSTIKNAPRGKIQQTLLRENLWETETPQVVRAQEFIKAVKSAGKKNFTDDLAVLEAAGMETRVILASPRNRKITVKEDLPLSYAAGVGEDSHEFRKQETGNRQQGGRGEKWNSLLLGGIKIKGMPRCKAESDGDVILHALCNAIASAIGKGSLGTYATRMARNGIKDSKQYLRIIQNAMRRQHKCIRHCAIAIEAAQPKIDPIAPRIKKNLSRLLRIPIQNIGITATSGEKLTPFGKGEAMRCRAIVLVKEHGEP